MKIVSLCLLLFFVRTTPELASIRQNYIDAAVSEESAAAFHKSFENVEESNASSTLVAYKSASVVLLAKYESGLFEKTRLFNRGTKLLEATIKKAPDNYEARLIRFNIQDNVPWITGYTSDIKDDKSFLMRHYARQPEDLRLFTKRYIMQCDAFSAKEKAAFD
jgi:hypothetical protein